MDRLMQYDNLDLKAYDFNVSVDPMNEEWSANIRGCCTIQRRVGSFTGKAATLRYLKKSLINFRIANSKEAQLDFYA
jgi:hypothetical protein